MEIAASPVANPLSTYQSRLLHLTHLHESSQRIVRIDLGFLGAGCAWQVVVGLHQPTNPGAAALIVVIDVDSLIPIKVGAGRDIAKRIVSLALARGGATHGG